MVRNVAICYDFSSILFFIKMKPSCFQWNLYAGSCLTRISHQLHFRRVQLEPGWRGGHVRVTLMMPLYDFPEVLLDLTFRIE